MVMGLNFKYNTQSVTDIHQSRIFFSRFHQHFLSVTGKCFQPSDGIFIAAMFAPHGTECTELGKVGGPAQFLTNQFKLFCSSRSCSAVLTVMSMLFEETAKLRRTR